MWIRELKQKQSGAYLKLVTYLRISTDFKDISKKEICLVSPMKSGSRFSAECFCQEIDFINTTANLFSLSCVSLYCWCA